MEESTTFTDIIQELKESTDFAQGKKSGIFMTLNEHPSVVFFMY